MRLPVLALLLVARAAHGGRPALDDLGDRFPPGPYSALAVDAEQGSVVIGTEDGQLLVSQDAGRGARPITAFAPRHYGAYPVRAALARSTTLRLAPPGARPLRLITSLREQGFSAGSWAAWMAVDDPAPAITAVTPVWAGGQIFAASAGGLARADARAGVAHLVAGDGVALSIALRRGDPAHILVGTTAGLLRSRDGGQTFERHPDRQLRDASIRIVLFAPDDPATVLVASGATVFRSDDQGATFAELLAAGAEVLSLAVAGDVLFVGTAGGLYVVSERETTHPIRGQPVVGIVPRPGGDVLAATEHELLLVSGGTPARLLATGAGEPFLALAGGPRVAFAITRRALLRIGQVDPRVAPADPPRLAISAQALERAVTEHLGLPAGGGETRFARRWYASLLPTLAVEIDGTRRRDLWRELDGSRPAAFGNGSDVRAATGPHVAAWATWDLSSVVFGDRGGISNPGAILEKQARQGREQLLGEVRARYQECARLLAAPRVPSEPYQAVLWRTRVDELASYLEALSGRQVVDRGQLAGEGASP